MPHSFLKAFLFLTIVLFFTECKKGEDDPFFSINSRKARLTGKWKLTGGKALYHDPANNINYNFSESGYSAYVRLGNKGYDTLGDYRLQLEIVRNGVFKVSETYQSAHLDCSGKWNFNQGVGKQKGKVDAVFSIDKVNEGFTSGHLFNRMSANFVYHIQELRNKKLVITSKGRIYSDTKGNYATFTSEYTFEQ